MKINIQYSKYLDPIFIAYVHSYEKWANYPVPEKDFVLEKTEVFRKTWEVWGEKIISAIEGITKLSYNKDIDVYIVSLNPRTYSNPIIIRSNCTSEEFVNLLTEELIHVIFDNGKLWKSIFKHAKWKYPDENDSVLVHFIVYSIIDEVYKIIDKDFATTKIDTAISNKNSDYARAKELANVDKNYIIEALRDDTSDIK